MKWEQNYYPTVAGALLKYQYLEIRILKISNHTELSYLKNWQKNWSKTTGNTTEKGLVMVYSSDEKELTWLKP